jgi:hypothetical protein
MQYVSPLGYAWFYEPGRDWFSSAVFRITRLDLIASTSARVIIGAWAMIHTKSRSVLSISVSIC